MKIRGISQDFINDLKKNNGPLNWIYKKVTALNSKYSVGIRDHYINVYYNGGSLLKITEKGNHTYDFKFDEKYGKRNQGISKLDDGRVVKYVTQNGIEKVVQWSDFMAKHYDEVQKLDNITAKKYFDKLELEMDGWFKEHPNREKYYQHQISLSQNNDNVLDIEFAIGNSGMRLDMIMVDNKGDLYLIENKYGNDAIYSWISENTKKKKENPNASNPGLSKHYKDYIRLLNNEKYKENLTNSMRSILKNKQVLKMIPDSYTIADEPTFHIVFVLANLNFSSRKRRKAEDVINELDYEKDIIRENTTKEYIPYMLLTKDNEYRIKLDDATPLLDYDFKKVLL